MRNDCTQFLKCRLLNLATGKTNNESNCWRGKKRESVKTESVEIKEKERERKKERERER